MAPSDHLWVIDTSVAAAWFFLDENLRDKSLVIRDSVQSDPHLFVVPGLFHSELIHVLARKSGHDRRLVEQSMRLIIRLGMRTLSTHR